MNFAKMRYKILDQVDVKKTANEVFISKKQIIEMFEGLKDDVSGYICPILREKK